MALKAMGKATALLFEVGKLKREYGKTSTIGQINGECDVAR